MKKNLATMYLRIDSSSKSLTKRALAQLLLKIIYFYDSPPTKDQVTIELTGILGASLSTKKIDEAFELLMTDAKIAEQHGKYLIFPEKKDNIDAAVMSSYHDKKELLNIILDQYQHHQILLPNGLKT